MGCVLTGVKVPTLAHLHTKLLAVYSAALLPAAAVRVSLAFKYFSLHALHELDLAGLDWTGEASPHH